MRIPTMSGSPDDRLGRPLELRSVLPLQPFSKSIAHFVFSVEEILFGRSTK